MDDVRAVMDAAGSERAAIIGMSDGAPMSLLFAATYPHRTGALVLFGGLARTLWAPTTPGDGRRRRSRTAPTNGPSRTSQGSTSRPPTSPRRMPATTNSRRSQLFSTMEQHPALRTRWRE